MPAPPRDAAMYLAQASPRYRATHAALGRAVRRVFPRAKPVFRWGMPGWVAQRPKGAPMPPRAGTMDPTCTAVMLAEGTSRITAHVFYPGDYDLLAKHRAALAEAGLKAGRGCLVWTRAGEFPVPAVEWLLRQAKHADAKPAARNG